MRVALVLGGSASLWRDVEEALEIGAYAGAVACNDAAAVWPGRLDAAVSLHGEKHGIWMGQRRKSGLPMPDHVLGHATLRSGIVRTPDCITGFTDHRFDGQRQTGSSGLFALKVALVDLGFDRAVLCGVPMNGQSHFFDTASWADGARAHWRGWVEAMPAIKDKTRSMSGRTAEVLGRPDKQWLGQ